MINLSSSLFTKRKRESVSKNYYENHERQHEMESDLFDHGEIMNKCDVLIALKTKNMVRNRSLRCSDSVRFQAGL